MAQQLVSTDMVRQLRAQPRRGVLIAVEGVPGSGKTTQLRLLESHLRRHHQRLPGVVAVHDEVGTALGEQLHTLLRATKKLDARADALLRAGARAQLVATVVRPALTRGAVVLCEGWVDSYRAAHTHEDADHEMVEHLVRYSSRRIRPDLTVLLDVPAPVSMLRGTTTSAIRRARVQALPAVERMRNLLLAQAVGRKDRYLAVPATDAPQEIAQVIAARVDALLAQRAGVAAGVRRAAV